jgi:hypothetical protein
MKAFVMRPQRGSYKDRDSRIAHRPGCGWDDAHTPASRRAVKRSTARARRARSRAIRHAVLRGEWE